jgi:hypothetical protein
MRYLLIGTLSVALLSASGCGHWLGRAVDMVSDQVDPYELQRKYELFKDQAAQLDKKKADIAVYEKRFRAFGSKNLDCPETLSRARSEQCLVWTQEVAGVIASYNGLAAEYNANMSKWNYSFCNIGTLPKGATETLPREFKPYIYE